jgi:hypothetical protein
MHSLRGCVLLRDGGLTIHGRRLTLIDLARAWPHAERILAPLKALDRVARYRRENRDAHERLGSERRG